MNRLLIILVAVASALFIFKDALIAFAKKHFSKDKNDNSNNGTTTNTTSATTNANGQYLENGQWFNGYVPTPIDQRPQDTSPTTPWTAPTPTPARKRPTYWSELKNKIGGENALFGNKAKYYYVTSPTTKHRDIQFIQCAINALLYCKNSKTEYLVCDGSFGRKTETACYEVHGKNGMSINQAVALCSAYTKTKNKPTWWQTALAPYGL